MIPEGLSFNLFVWLRLRGQVSLSIVAYGPTLYKYIRIMHYVYDIELLYIGELNFITNYIYTYIMHIPKNNEITYLPI